MRANDEQVLTLRINWADSKTCACEHFEACDRIARVAWLRISNSDSRAYNVISLFVGSVAPMCQLLDVLNGAPMFTKRTRVRLVLPRK